VLLRELIAENKQTLGDIRALAQEVMRIYNKKQRPMITAQHIKGDYPQIEKMLPFLKIMISSKMKQRGAYTGGLVMIQNRPDQEDAMISSLVHELQHAWDDYRSKHQFMKDPKPYVTKHGEVNARFSQALAELERQFERLNLDPKRFADPQSRSVLWRLIGAVLKKYQLDPQTLDQGQRKRIMSRVYQYFKN
jgi:DNA repair ATPase RecN